MALNALPVTVRLESPLVRKNVSEPQQGPNPSVAIRFQPTMLLAVSPPIVPSVWMVPTMLPPKTPIPVSSTW